MPPAVRAPDSGVLVVFEPQKTHSHIDTVTWSEDSGCMLPVHVPALSTMVGRSQMKICFLNSFDAISTLNNGAFTLTEAETDNFYRFQYPTALVSRCSMNTSTQYISHFFLGLCQYEHTVVPLRHERKTQLQSL